MPLSFVANYEKHLLEVSPSIVQVPYRLKICFSFKWFEGWECGSMVERLLSVHEALLSTQSAALASFYGGTRLQSQHIGSDAGGS